jgi:aerobic-type carbon monoxide dehydrogenase small subunit (CoxS/CutS family)
MPVRRIRLNGKVTEAEYQTAGSGANATSERLLYWLREQFDQHGPRFGCGVKQCGACTVLMDGTPTRSCTAELVKDVPDNAEIRTLDGLANGTQRHPLQEAFVKLQAGQCAFCANGVVMGALGWWESRIAAGNRAVPSTSEIQDFLSGATQFSDFNYLCRCGTHTRITEAIRTAAEEMVK